MKRIYKDTAATDAVRMFVGTEVEHTPAFGMQTLFVVGIHNVTDIEVELIYHKCEHIFFGANQSFNPVDQTEFEQWEIMISHFLTKGFMCSMDVPTDALPYFIRTSDVEPVRLIDHNTFIIQVSVRIPHVDEWNANTMIKIDDVDFDATNPGVWTHKLSDLKDSNKFTDWSKYKSDTIISSKKNDIDN